MAMRWNASCGALSGANRCPRYRCPAALDSRDQATGDDELGA